MSNFLKNRKWTIIQHIGECVIALAIVVLFYVSSVFIILPIIYDRTIELSTNTRIVVLFSTWVLYYLLWSCFIPRIQTAWEIYILIRRAREYEEKYYSDTHPQEVDSLTLKRRHELEHSIKPKLLQSQNTDGYVT